MIESTKDWLRNIPESWTKEEINLPDPKVEMHLPDEIEDIIENMVDSGEFENSEQKMESETNDQNMESDILKIETNDFVTTSTGNMQGYISIMATRKNIFPLKYLKFYSELLFFCGHKGLYKTGKQNKHSIFFGLFYVIK